jgi:protein O-mannosyl-transferase
MLITSSTNEQKRPAAKFWLALILLYALVTAVLFGWTIFHAYFFSDDFTWLWHGAKINLDLGRVLTFRMSSFYSPVLNFFYTVMLKVFGFAAPAYFTFDLIVHWLNAVLAAIIAWQLSRSRLVAALTGLLFVWAGTAFEPLIWVGANMHSFATFFILAGIASYLAYLSSGRKIYLPLALLAAILAIGSKEIAVVLPLLLAAGLCIFWPEYKNKVLARAHWLYWAAMAILFFLYAIQQFIWQKQSAAVASGTFAFSWHTIAKLPIVITDLFIPLANITPQLHHLNVGWLILFCAVFTAGIFLAYRKLPLIRFGFAWMIISVMPTIFLATVNWWDPLASRYTYLPRFGMALILAAILHYHLGQKKSRYPAIIAAVAIVALLAIQFSYMTKLINRDYPYVYQTGRSLVTAMAEVKGLTPEKLLIQWDHPFTANNAHLVGAAIVIGGLKEDMIVFPPPEEKIKLKPGEILLYWDGTTEQYLIKLN